MAPRLHPIGIACTLATLLLIAPAFTAMITPGDAIETMARHRATTVDAVARTNGPDELIVLAHAVEIPPRIARSATRHLVQQEETSDAAATSTNSIRAGHAEAPKSSTRPRALVADPSRLSLEPTFDRWARTYGVPTDLLKALAWYESGWDNQRRSSAGAVGIGQILPITADWISEHLLAAELDPSVTEDNIELTARYLRHLIDETGDVTAAVAAYYQGLTATRRQGILSSSSFYVEGVMALRERFA